MEGGKSVRGHVIKARYSSVRSTDGDIKTPEARRGSEMISKEERELIFWRSVLLDGIMCCED